MGQYETMKADEVTIGDSNFFREGELEDVATAVYEPDGKARPVTVGELLFGDGSGSPPMGILSGQPAERTESNDIRSAALLATFAAFAEIHQTKTYWPASRNGTRMADSYQDLNQRRKKRREQRKARKAGRKGRA